MNAATTSTNAHPGSTRVQRTVSSTSKATTASGFTIDHVVWTRTPNTPRKTIALAPEKITPRKTTTRTACIMPYSVRKSPSSIDTDMSPRRVRRSVSSSLKTSSRPYHSPGKPRSSPRTPRNRNERRNSMTDSEQTHTTRSSHSSSSRRRQHRKGSLDSKLPTQAARTTLMAGLDDVSFIDFDKLLTRDSATRERQCQQLVKCLVHLKALEEIEMEIDSTEGGDDQDVKETKKERHTNKEEAADKERSSRRSRTPKTPTRTSTTPVTPRTPKTPTTPRTPKTPTSTLSSRRTLHHRRSPRQSRPSSPHPPPTSRRSRRHGDKSRERADFSKGVGDFDDAFDNPFMVVSTGSFFDQHHQSMPGEDFARF